MVYMFYKTSKVEHLLFVHSGSTALYEGLSSITRKNTAKVLSLPQDLQVHPIRKIEYCQLFMHVIMDFYATISKLRLVRQR